MSVQATTAVWEHSKATGADLVTMLAIADAANAEGQNAFPGMPRLERYCRKDKRNVLASIRRCIQRGELERVQDAHRGRVAVYDVLLPGLARWGKGDDIDAKGDADAPALISSNHEPLTSRARAQNATSEAHPFDEFWILYPRRNGRRLEKAKAIEQWKKLREPDRFRSMVGVRVYADACARGEQTAKDAFRWLRDRSFDEWAEFAANAGSPGLRSVPPPECEHGMSLKAHCDDCEAEGIAQDERRAV